MSASKQDRELRKLVARLDRSGQPGNHRANVERLIKSHIEQEKDARRINVLLGEPKAKHYTIRGGSVRCRLGLCVHVPHDWIESVHEEGLTLAPDPWATASRYDHVLVLQANLSVEMSEKYNCKMFVIQYTTFKSFSNIIGGNAWLAKFGGKLYTSHQAADDAFRKACDDTVRGLNGV